MHTLYVVYNIIVVIDIFLYTINFKQYYLRTKWLNIRIFIFKCNIRKLYVIISENSHCE